MVKVEDVALDPGEMVEGLKAQLRPAGAVQESVISPVNPPTALALIMRSAIPPIATVAFWAERLRVKLAPVAVAGTRLAKTEVALPPVGKLGWALPPAVRYRVFGSPEAPPPPNTMSHKPGFTNALFEESVSWPRNFPVLSNASMVPSPKFPTRIAFGNSPKVAGVATTPQGALSWTPEAPSLAPAATKVLTKLPLVSKISICPSPAPGWASSL